MHDQSRDQAICTTAAVTDIALQTLIQRQNFIQNWTKDAHTIWVTQVQIDGKNQDKLHKLKTAIQKKKHIKQPSNGLEIN